RLAELLPEALAALPEHRALEDAHQRQREVEREDVVLAGLGRLAVGGEAQAAPAAGLGRLEQRASPAVAQLLPAGGDVAADRPARDAAQDAFQLAEAHPARPQVQLVHHEREAESGGIRRLLSPATGLPRTSG